MEIEAPQDLVSLIHNDAFVLQLKARWE